MFFFPTHLVYFLLRSLYGMYYTIKRVHSSLPEVSLMMLPLFTLFLFSLRRRKRERQRGCFFSRVAKEGLASSLFAGKKRREIFRFGEFIIDRFLPKTTTQLNSPLSSATILIPQNFFFLFVRAKAPPPQKQNKTNHFYEHV